MYYAGGTAALPLLRWSCVAEADIDADDDVVMMSDCPDVCGTLTDCAACMSAGAQCVWSLSQQQVCYS